MTSAPTTCHACGAHYSGNAGTASAAIARSPAMRRSVFTS